jgi:hypothetical protein
LIFGLPRVALERGAVMRQFPLSQIAHGILDACDGIPFAKMPESGPHRAVGVA